MLLRAFCVALSVFLGSSLFSPLFFSSEADGGEKGATVCLEGYELDGGEVEIAIMLDSPRGVSGILFELFYDEDEFLLLSVGAEGCGLDLTHRDAGGAVAILLDGVENTAKTCKIARLYFKRRTDSTLGAEFVIGEDVRAFSLRENAFSEEIISVEVARFCVGDIGRDKCGEVELDSVSARICDGGEVELDFSLSFSGEAFALGLELFVIDHGGEGECFEVLVSSAVALESEGDILAVKLDVSEAFCIVVTPTIYEGRTATAGEKRVAIINVRNRDAYVEVK